MYMYVGKHEKHTGNSKLENIAIKPLILFSLGREGVGGWTGGWVEVGGK